MGDKKVKRKFSWKDFEPDDDEVYALKHNKPTPPPKSPDKPKPPAEKPKAKKSAPELKPKKHSAPESSIRGSNSRSQKDSVKEKKKSIVSPPPPPSEDKKQKGKEKEKVKAKSKEKIKKNESMIESKKEKPPPPPTPKKEKPPPPSTPKKEKPPPPPPSPPQPRPQQKQKSTHSTRPQSKKDQDMAAAMARIQNAKPYVSATPEMRKKMNFLLAHQERSGFFQLTQSFSNAIGVNYNVLKLEAINKEFHPHAWATALAMAYIDRRMTPLKGEHIKEYDRAKLWVYKNYAVSQKRLERAAIMHFR